MNVKDAAKHMIDGKIAIAPNLYRWRCVDWQFQKMNCVGDWYTELLVHEDNEGWELVKEPLRVEFDAFIGMDIDGYPIVRADNRDTLRGIKFETRFKCTLEEILE